MKTAKRQGKTMHNAQYIMHNLKSSAISALPCLCAMLFFSLLIANCSFDSPKPPPPDKVAVHLKLNNTLRSIMPEASLDHFNFYEIYFDGMIENDGDVDIFDDPIYLDPGTYDLVVKAYTSSDNTDLAAQFSRNGIDIEAEPIIQVTLSPITPDGTTNGSFSWNISFEPGLNISKFVINVNDMDDDPVTLFPKTFTSPSNPLIGSDALPSGYYRVIFELENDKGVEIQWRQILHVFQHLASNFTYTFKEAHFTEPGYTVKFYYNDDANNIETENYLLNDTVDEPIIAMPRPGWYLEGWYTQPNKGGTRWNFATDTVAGNMELHAWWQAEQDYGLNLELTNYKPKLQIDGGAAIADDQIIPLIIGDTVTINVTNTSDGLTNINWYYNNAVTPIATGTPCTFNSSMFDNTPGLKLITVQAEKGSVLYSTKLSISIFEYKLGDTGPGGGRIFYVADGQDGRPLGFTVEGVTITGDYAHLSFTTYTAYYLEAAPTNTTPSTAPWGGEILVDGVTTSNSTTTIGNGRKDTLLIVARFATQTAAQLCATASFSSKNDWFLPSIGELYVYHQSNVNGKPATGWYWSSSQLPSAANAFYIDFNSSVGTPSDVAKGNSNNFRPIRAF